MLIILNYQIIVNAIRRKMKRTSRFFLSENDYDYNFAYFRISMYKYNIKIYFVNKVLSSILISLSRND